MVFPWCINVSGFALASSAVRAALHPREGRRPPVALGNGPRWHQIETVHNGVAGVETVLFPRHAVNAVVRLDGCVHAFVSGRQRMLLPSGARSRVSQSRFPLTPLWTSRTNMRGPRLDLVLVEDVSEHAVIGFGLLFPPGELGIGGTARAVLPLFQCP